MRGQADLHAAKGPCRTEEGSTRVTECFEGEGEGWMHWEQCCQMAKLDPFLSLDCARVEGAGAQSKERKGSYFAAQRSGAIVKKPEGPNTYNFKNPAIANWQP